MNKKKILSVGLLVLGIIVIIPIFFVRIYVSSPGFVTQKAQQEFEDHKPTCYGFSTLLNVEEVMVDSPAVSVCIGFLDK